MNLMFDFCYTFFKQLILFFLSNVFFFFLKRCFLVSFHFASQMMYKIYKSIRFEWDTSSVTVATASTLKNIKNNVAGMANFYIAAQMVASRWLWRNKISHKWQCWCAHKAMIVWGHNHTHGAKDHRQKIVAGKEKHTYVR